MTYFVRVPDSMSALAAGGVYCSLITEQLRRGRDCVAIQNAFRGQLAEFFRLRAAVIMDGLAIGFSEQSSWASLKGCSWMSPSRFAVHVGDVTRDPKKSEYEWLLAELHVDAYDGCPVTRDGMDVWEVDVAGSLVTPFENGLHLVRYGIRTNQLRRLFVDDVPKLRVMLKQKGVRAEVCSLDELADEIIKNPA